VHSQVQLQVQRMSQWVLTGHLYFQLVEESQAVRLCDQDKVDVFQWLTIQ